jgi:hypothetical protein
MSCILPIRHWGLQSDGALMCMAFLKEHTGRIWQHPNTCTAAAASCHVLRVIACPDMNGDCLCVCVLAVLVVCQRVVMACK